MTTTRIEQARAERQVKGLLGTKLGMTQVWDAENRIVPVTVIQAEAGRLAARIGPAVATFPLGSRLGPVSLHGC